MHFQFDMVFLKSFLAVCAFFLAVIAGYKRGEKYFKDQTGEQISQKMRPFETRMDTLENEVKGLKKEVSDMKDILGTLSVALAECNGSLKVVLQNIGEKAICKKKKTSRK